MVVLFLLEEELDSFLNEVIIAHVLFPASFFIHKILDSHCSDHVRFLLSCYHCLGHVMAQLLLLFLLLFPPLLLHLRQLLLFLFFPF